MLGFMGDIKDVAKAWTAIAYFYKDCTVADVANRISKYTKEQKKRWVTLFMDMYEQVEDGICLPDGEDYYQRFSPNMPEEDKPF